MSDVPTVQERAAEVILPFMRWRDSAAAAQIAAALAAAGLLADPTTSPPQPHPELVALYERGEGTKVPDPATSRTDDERAEMALRPRRRAADGTLGGALVAEMRDAADLLDSGSELVALSDDIRWLVSQQTEDASYLIREAAARVIAAVDRLTAPGPKEA